MKSFVRAAIVFGVGVWGASAMAADFNGRWSVNLVTESGSCDRSYHSVVSVRDGQVQGGGDATLSGAVSSGGAVSIGIRKGIASGNASGYLRGNSGSGTWQAAGVSSSRWTARRSLVTASRD